MKRIIVAVFAVSTLLSACQSDTGASSAIAATLSTDGKPTRDTVAIVEGNIRTAIDAETLKKIGTVKELSLKIIADSIVGNSATQASILDGLQTARLWSISQPSDHSLAFAVDEVMPVVKQQIELVNSEVEKNR